MYRREARYPTSQLFKETNLLDIRQLYAKNLLTHLYRTKSNLTYVNHNQNTRAKTSKKLTNIKFNKKIGQRSILYLGPKLFNILPDNIKDTQNLNKFRAVLKNWLLETDRERIRRIIEG